MFFKSPIAVYTNNFKIRILRKSGVLQISSWSHIKINYYIQSTSENRTFGFQTVPKSQQSAVRYGLVRISNVRDQSYTVRYLNIQISDSWDQNPDWLKSERSVWPFGPNCLKSERSDFRQLGPNRNFSFGLLPTFWNPNDLVRISDVQLKKFGLVPTVWNLNVRKPNHFS